MLRPQYFVRAPDYEIIEARRIAALPKRRMGEAGAGLEMAF